MKIKTLDGLKIKITKNAHIVDSSSEMHCDDKLFINVQFQKETTMSLRVNQKQYKKLLNYIKEGK